MATRCHFCGDEESPHMLSNCRPDLLEHEPGPLCTWANTSREVNKNCYAFLDRKTNTWTNEHKHFDGPDIDMTS